jgi:ribose transport system permease protein
MTQTSSTATETIPELTEGPMSRWRLALNPVVLAYGAVLLLAAVGGILDRNFLASDHLFTMVNLGAVLGIVAAGQTIVIVTGGIDLSVAGVLTFAQVMTPFWIDGQSGRWPLIIVILGIALLIGAVNAFGVSVLRVQPMIMTLGVGAVISAAVLILTNGSSTGGPPKFLVTTMTRQGALSGLLLMWIVVSIVTYILLHESSFGRKVFAYGASARTARLAGLRSGTAILGTYCFSAVTAAMAGIALAGYTGSGDFGIGDTYLFPSIGAVVIGGTSILGGRGNYLGTIAGVLILTVLEAILIVLNITAAGRQIAEGLAILIILIAYARERRLRQ